MEEGKVGEEEQNGGELGYKGENDYGGVYWSPEYEFEVRFYK